LVFFFSEQRAGITSLYLADSNLGAVQPGELRGHLTAAFQYLKGPARELERDF